MKWNQYSKAATIAIFVCLGLVTCEDFADETYTLTVVDAAAIAAISDTLELAMPMKTATILKDGINLGVILTGGGIDTVIMTVDSLTVTVQDVVMAMESAGVSAITANDTAYSMTIRNDSLAFRPFTVASSGTYVLYLNHHVAPSIYSATTYAKVDLVSDDMSPELIAGLYDLPGPVPVIKGRYEYELPPGDYLFEIARMEATNNNNFRAVLIREQ